ncbi:hypothetical protein [Pararoseomonas baculiformis]
MVVTIPYRPRRGPLHLVINSTGPKVLGEGEWKARKHGPTSAGSGARWPW